MRAFTRPVGRRLLAAVCAVAAVVAPSGQARADQVVRAEPALVAQSLPSMVSLRSFNYPDHYVRHRNGIGEISRVRTNLDFQDATFRVRPGLANSRLVSFESVNYPRHYLRHQNALIRLSRQTSDSLFRSDATFHVRSGLAGRSARSFESYNYPRHYLRHRFGLLYIDRHETTDLYRRDATFHPVVGLWPR